MKSVNQLFTEILKNNSDEIYVQNPCEVVNVNGNYVDVLLYINDEDEDTIIYNVPIQRPETQRAYVFLGIKKGDRGICRFFDRSTEGYLQSDFDYNSDERQHDINDRCFELGFIPDKESYVYPTDKEIEIGLKNKKFILSVDENGNLSVSTDNNITLTVKGNVTETVTGNVNLTANTINTTGTFNHTGDINVTGKITVSGEITGNNILLSQHTHIGNLGNPTSTPQ